MNIARGLFRLWIVGSVLFVIVVGLVAYDGVKSEFERAPGLYPVIKDDKVMLPVDCGKARGVRGADYVYEKVEGPWIAYGGQPKELCWYSEAKVREKYTEYNDMDDRDLMRRAYKAAGLVVSEAPAPWMSLFAVVGFAIGIPLGVLALGSALYWAVTGFRTAA